MHAPQSGDLDFELFDHQIAAQERVFSGFARPLCGVKRLALHGHEMA